MRSYRRLTRDDRIMIHRRLEQGKKQIEIAQELGVDRSSISREISRNKAVKAPYNWRGAHSKAVASRRALLEYGRKIEGPLEELVIQLLVERLSPQQISNRLRAEDARWSLSHETIYNWIYNMAPDFKECLRWKSRRRQKRARRPRKSLGKFPKKMIDQRPEQAELRAEIGHWERDLVEGRRGRAALLVIHDRKSRMTIVRKIKSKHATDVNKATAESLKDQVILSMTNDNGVEFGCCEELEKLIGASVYYCHAYSSWERGSVENVNGLLRQYFPKGTDFEEVSDEEIKQAQDAINRRPKKVLGYKAPLEVHDNQKIKIIRSESYYRHYAIRRSDWNFKEHMIKEVGYFLE